MKKQGESPRGGKRWFTGGKRIFAALVCAVMLATSLAATAFAADSYDIWVNNVQITSDNAADVLGNGTVSYNAVTKTLTLNGASLNQVYNASNSAAIYADGDLNIVLENNNEISVNSGGYSCCGIYTGGKLTIGGAGALDVRADAAALPNRAIEAVEVEIDNGAVTLYASGNEGYGAFNSSIGSMKINGGTVEISGGSLAVFMYIDLSGYAGCSAIASGSFDGSNPGSYDSNSLFYYKYLKVYTFTPNYDEYGFDGDNCKPAELNDNGTPVDATDDWYEITNAGNLFWFNALLKNDETEAGADARLTNNITIPGGKNWVPLSVGTYGTGYEGTFDGQGFSISDLSIAQHEVWPETSTGLFKGVKASGVVKNLQLKDVDVNMPADHVGAICGWNEGIVENCHIISGNVKGAFNVGGICGDNMGTVTKCSNAAAVDKAQTGYGYYAFGGICGGQSGASAQTTYCYNTGSITANSNAGGICGEQEGGRTLGCYNTGTVTNGRPISSAYSGVPDIQQCYWLADTEVEAGEKTAAQFASGEVAYLLNGRSSADTVVWRQTISGGSAQPYPTFQGSIVYYGYAFCYSETESYENDPAKVFADKPPHAMEEATCTEPAKCSNAGCTKTEGDAKGHTYDNDADMICNDCQYNRTVYATPPALDPIQYQIIEGQSGGWTQGDGDGLRFTANVNYGKFMSVSVDGFPLSNDKYTVQSGSTIVTLKTSYLETLLFGQHTLRIDFTDCYVETSFTTEARMDVPQTGDSSMSGLWIAIMLAAGVALVAGVALRRKQR